MMDLSTVTTVVVLTALLLTWYALLEYVERRRRRKDAVPAETPAATGGREAGRERGRGAALYVHRYWRSNGKPAPRARPSPTPVGQSLMYRGTPWRYGFAATSVLLAYGLVTLGSLLFAFPPLIFFAAAVAVTVTLAGPAPGLFALILATLLSDFFFIRPTFVFSLDRQVFKLSLLYLFGALLSAFISKRLSSTSAAS